MKYLHSMLLKLFLPTFLAALTFFIVLLQVIDLFQNLSLYVREEVPLLTIIQIAGLYIPKAINISLPMALLFSISFTMGNLYSNNELISIFASGIKLIKFVYPLIVIGLLLSFFGFYFDDKVVISTYSKKNELQDRALSKVKSLDNDNVALTSKDRKIIYDVKYYNDRELSISNVLIIRRDDKMRLLERLDANKGYWRDGLWEFSEVVIYKLDQDKNFYISSSHTDYRNEIYNLPPESFKNPIKEVSEMNLKDARKWIDHLETTGKHKRALEDYMDYLERYSMTLTPLIVAFISCAIGGRFKKNVLLMSLLSSLSISVCYYVFQMVTVELSIRLVAIPPLMGAWAPFIIFTIVGLDLFRKAKT